MTELPKLEPIWLNDDFKKPSWLDPWKYRRNHPAFGNAMCVILVLAGLAGAIRLLMLARDAVQADIQRERPVQVVAADTVIAMDSVSAPVVTTRYRVERDSPVAGWASDTVQSWIGVNTLADADTTWTVRFSTQCDDTMHAFVTPQFNADRSAVRFIVKTGAR